MAGPHLAEWQGTCSALSLSYELRTSSWRPVTRNPTSLFQPAKLGVCGFWPLVAPNTAASSGLARARARWPGRAGKKQPTARHFINPRQSTPCC